MNTYRLLAGEILRAALKDYERGIVAPSEIRQWLAEKNVTVQFCACAFDLDPDVLSDKFLKQLEVIETRRMR